MNEEFMRELIAELLDAQEQAFAIAMNAVGDVTDRKALATALQARLKTAQAAAAHPIRDSLIATAAKALRA